MKKRLLLIILVLSISVSFSGCSKKSPATPSLEDTLAGTGLIPIPGEDNLAYYEDGRSVYIVINYYENLSSQALGYMAPLVRNGHFCEYINEEIVEVD